MALLFKTKQQLKTRLPLFLFLLILIAIGPILISMIGAEWVKHTTGQPCHEGNCEWAVFFWFSFFTIPISGVLLIILLLISIADAKSLSSTE